MSTPAVIAPFTLRACAHDERFHGNQHRRHGDGKAHGWEHHQRCKGRTAPTGNTEGTDGDDGNEGKDKAEAQRSMPMEGAIMTASMAG